MRAHPPATESPPSSPDILLTPLPIALSLDTPHDLPHVSTFRLHAPSTILGALGRNRKLDISQSIWDRMPSALGIKMSDEDSVERMLGGKFKPEHINSIYVHPPTPERETPEESPRVNLVPLQVLPEVRSPPRKNLAMAADSLQLTLRRGRRPRLFGFTEIPDSSSSSRNSSANNSKNNSPERQPTQTLPRRPVRTQSETHLPTLKEPRKRETGLKLDFSGIVPINSQPGTPSAKLIRKKSGELVKPALKYSGPLTAGGTPIGEPSPRFETKSLPSTPSFPKYVHFDSQLERVKLFNKDHKPQVVSRDGSPQYTTSEGEEFPFPSTDEESEKLLQIKLPNFPTHQPDSDLYLESIYLDDDRKSLRGVVVVRNFSFSKWVAVRFTFDWWQTTSEVSASYKESIKGGEFDRFAFQVKLGDMMAKIEEKTLFLCVRYNSEGREIWDSNGGQNYQVNFERSAGKSRGKAVGGRQWSVKGKEDDRMADLREKLNRLTAEDDLQPQLSPNRSSMKWASPTSSPLKGVTDLPSLSSRYDFNTALKGSPEVRNAELPGLLFRPGMDYYSPVYESDVFASPTPIDTKVPTPLPIPNTIAIPDLKVQGPSPPPPESPISRPALIRSTTSPAKLTSPKTLSSSPRQSPSPPLLSESSSSTEPSDSPKSPPELGLSRFAESRVRGSDDSMASYSSFIEQFCWGGSTLNPSTSEPRRTHSSSTLDEYFAHSSGSGYTTPRPLLTQTYTQYSPAGSPGMVWKRSKEDDAGIRAGLGGVNGFGAGNVSPPVRVGV